jgi:hypothetical protein
MKRSLLYSALFLGQFTTVSTAQAQKSYALGFGGGATVPVGRLSNNQKSGYNAMIALAIGVSDLPVGVRFDGVYNSLSHDKAAANGVDLRVSGSWPISLSRSPAPTLRRTYLPEAASITPSPMCPARNRKTISDSMVVSAQHSASVHSRRLWNRDTTRFRAVSRRAECTNSFR